MAPDSSTATGLAGRTVVVTGAGRGLGAAYARLCAARGAQVVVSDIDEDSASETVAASAAAAGGSAAAFACDVSDWTAAEALAGFALRTFESLDGLVNNAGILIPAVLDDIAEADLATMLAVNVAGTVAVTVSALPAMRRTGSGAIVNVTSGAQAGDVALSAYGATKAAVASLTYAWAAEL